MSEDESTEDIPIVRGIMMSPTGEVSVHSDVHEPLFDLALALEAQTQLPVDVEHVIAAFVLASRHGQVMPIQSVTARDRVLIETLTVHVRAVFDRYGGMVCEDDGE
ncbi:hypothetical protein [Calycomorphotria hydatis]|uniref:Uncharacterized protein n=1 Tax=Calycomorphotria hydatis TaxID=2528027 RepID=A0A517T7W1_9PLAN|nr:hypothetical protein [Calycomorphotria hydatis]QDT64463.1 hypothetical protein V22_16970 [Calycomorphotria hydatis]